MNIFATNGDELEKSNLEVEDDGPDESKHNGRTPVHNIRGVDVHQLDLIKTWSRMDVEDDADLLGCVSLQIICWKQQGVFSATHCYG